MVAEKAAEVMLQEPVTAGRLAAGPRSVPAQEEETSMAYDDSPALEHVAGAARRALPQQPARRDPRRRGEGHGDRRPRHDLLGGRSPSSSTTSRGRARPSTPQKGVLRNRILPLGLNAIIAKVYKGAELARRQGVHRPRLLRHVARRPLDPRRDPPDRPRHVPGQGLLGQEAPDRLRAPVLVARAVEALDSRCTIFRSFPHRTGRHMHTDESRDPGGPA